MTTSVLEPEVLSKGQKVGISELRIQCVYLTPTEHEFRVAARLLSGSAISMHHAATLEQADFQLARTRAKVLLTELHFPEGVWEDALEMLSESFPQVALVLAASDADEHLWIRALERGAFDLVMKPFRAEDLQRILENADAHCRATESDTSSFGADPEEDRSRSAGSN
jgi:DNA-binding NtrC family response regulator